MGPHIQRYNALENQLLCRKFEILIGAKLCVPHYIRFVLILVFIVFLIAILEEVVRKIRIMASLCERII